MPFHPSSQTPSTAYTDSFVVHLSSMLLGEAAGIHAASAMKSNTTSFCMNWRTPFLMKPTQLPERDITDLQPLFLDVSFAFVTPSSNSLSSSSSSSDTPDCLTPLSRVDTKFGVLFLLKNRTGWYTQSRPLTFRDLEQHAADVGLDLEDTLPLDLASLVAKALFSLANTNHDSHKGGSIITCPHSLDQSSQSREPKQKIKLVLNHDDLDESGSFIEWDGYCFEKNLVDSGAIGGKAMTMLLANFQTRSSSSEEKSKACVMGSEGDDTRKNAVATLEKWFLMAEEEFTSLSAKKKDSVRSNSVQNKDSQFLMKNHLATSNSGLVINRMIQIENSSSSQLKKSHGPDDRHIHECVEPIQKYNKPLSNETLVTSQNHMQSIKSSSNQVVHVRKSDHVAIGEQKRPVTEINDNVRSPPTDNPKRSRIQPEVKISSRTPLVIVKRSRATSTGTHNGSRRRGRKKLKIGKREDL